MEVVRRLYADPRGLTAAATEMVAPEGTIRDGVLVRIKAYGDPAEALEAGGVEE